MIGAEGKRAQYRQAIGNFKRSQTPNIKFGQTSVNSMERAIR